MAERTNTPHKIAEVLRAIIGKTEKKYFTSANFVLKYLR